MIVGLSLDIDLEWGAGYMVFAPFNKEHILSAIAHQILHIVVVVASVLHMELLAGSLGSVHAHVQDVIA